MSVLVDILVAALSFVYTMITLYTYVVFAAVATTWVGADPHNPVVRFLRQVTDPLLRPLRHRLWPLTRRLQVDLSPMVLIFGLIVVQILIRHLQAALHRGLLA